MLKIMQMNSKISLIKKEFKEYLKNKKILDILVFGSIIKGKTLPKDIDIAVITNEKIDINIPRFHIIFLKPEDFFINPPSLVHTLLREGYSLKNKRFLAESYKFSNKILFAYELKNLKASLKVKVVNILRGKNKEDGMITKNNGAWLANQVFIVPIEYDYIFERFFLHFGVKFKRYYLLMH